MRIWYTVSLLCCPNLPSEGVQICDILHPCFCHCEAAQRLPRQSVCLYGADVAVGVFIYTQPAALQCMFSLAGKQGVLSIRHHISL